MFAGLGKSEKICPETEAPFGRNIGGSANPHDLELGGSNHVAVMPVMRALTWCVLIAANSIISDVEVARTKSVPKLKQTPVRGCPAWMKYTRSPCLKMWRGRHPRPPPARGAMPASAFAPTLYLSRAHSTKGPAIFMYYYCKHRVWPYAQNGENCA